MPRGRLVPDPLRRPRSSHAHVPQSNLSTASPPSRLKHHAGPPAFPHGPPLQHDLVIRPLTAADVHPVRLLHSSTLPVQYPPAFFTQLLVLPSRACLIAVRRSSPDNPIAFVSAALHKSPVRNHPGLAASKTLDSPRPRIEILTLGVLPAYQHLGIARRLVAAVVQKLVGPLSSDFVVHANVSTTNSTAINFYQSIGLRVSSDVIPNLYRTCSYGQRDAYLVAGRLDDI